jgi:hypothetical protein
MYMIGALTHWVLGIGPIHLEEKFAEQVEEVRLGPALWAQVRSLGIGSRVLFDFSELDWADLAHLSISLGVLVLSMQAWRRPAVLPVTEPVEVDVVPLPVVAAPAPPTRRGRRSTSAANGRARVRRAEGSSSHTSLSPVELAPPGVRSTNGRHPAVKMLKEPTVRPKKKRASRRKPKIQFALVEEHRCPYCLDTVTRTDPGGVKECEVCHTLHHADCWAITGVCQVPHLNT